MKFRPSYNCAGWDNVLTYNGKEGEEGWTLFESKEVVGEDGATMTQTALKTYDVATLLM